MAEALPSICAKKWSDRGQFDAMVLDHLGTQFKEKIAALKALLDGASPESKTRAQDIETARKDLDDKSAALQAATEAITASESEEQAAKDTLKAADASLKAYMPEFNEG